VNKAKSDSVIGNSEFGENTGSFEGMTVGSLKGLDLGDRVEKGEGELRVVVETEFENDEAG
jgi:hypothetical protein